MKKVNKYTTLHNEISELRHCLFETEPHTLVAGWMPTGSRLWCQWLLLSSCGSSWPDCRLCHWAAGWGWGVASWCWNLPGLWPDPAFLFDAAARHLHLYKIRYDVLELLMWEAGSQDKSDLFIHFFFYITIFLLRLSRTSHSSWHVSCDKMLSLK